MFTPGGRIAAFMAGLAFFVPLGLARDRGRGIFVPSIQWEAWASLAYLITLGVVLLIALAMHWSLVERGHRKAMRPTPTRLILRVLTILILLALPVWVRGVVYGVYPILVDGPVLEQLEMVATFDRYRESTGYRSTRPWVVLKNVEHGTFRISVDETPEDLLPREGAEVVVTGRRTWIGDRYDKLPLLEH
jgi:hypothetical protein